MTRITLADEVRSGPQLVPGEPARLAAEGVRGVIDLRSDEELGLSLPPRAEAVEAREAGLEYHHIPFVVRDAETTLVDWFRRVLSTTHRPTLVHDRTGRRAGLLVLLNQALESGQDATWLLAEAERVGLGADVDDPLCALAVDYLESHSGASVTTLNPTAGLPPSLR